MKESKFAVVKEKTQLQSHFIGLLQHKACEMREFNKQTSELQLLKTKTETSNNKESLTCVLKTPKISLRKFYHLPSGQALAPFPEHCFFFPKVPRKQEKNKSDSST